MSSLALGTVEFGIDYGLKNGKKKVPEQEVARILSCAHARGIDTLDTAAAYGDSEAVLGRTMEKGEPFRIVSKYPAGPKGSLRDELKASLKRLGVPSLYGYLLHSFAAWNENPGLAEQLVACRDGGRVEKVGFSLYRPEEAERLMQAGAPLDIVQVPYSLLDRRFERIFERLSAYGAEIHVRSVFLQGLLFMEGKELHARFAPIRPVLERLHGLSRELDVSIAALCLGFAAANSFVAKIVIGVDSVRELELNLDSLEQGQRVSAAFATMPDLSTADEGIILPFNWR